MDFQNLYQVKRYIQNTPVKLAWRSRGSCTYCVKFACGDVLDLKFDTGVCMVNLSIKERGCLQYQLRTDGMPALLRILDDEVERMT
jgi:hypothetical protein